MPNIILIEDDAGIRELVTIALGDRYHIATASNVTDGERMLLEKRYDLILLDVSLPDGDGFRLCAQIRNSKENRKTPVIFLTGRTEIPDRVHGFSVGADDYLTKPFHIDELTARIEARLKVMMGGAADAEHFQVGNLRLSFNSHSLWVTEGANERSVETTPIEFKLVAFFVRHPNHLYSRHDLILEIWGDQAEISERSVDSHISNLRKKLGGASHTIQSIHGRGYKFVKQ